jgi:signal transduction histidine kinase
MKLPFLLLDSLRRKIVFGYTLIAGLVLGLSVFSLVDMRLLEEKILAGERVGEFLGLTLEIRRFEKNYLLYRQASDLEDNQNYITQARRLIETHQARFARFDSPERITAIVDSLARYELMMLALAAPGKNSLAEAAIRSTGKEIVTAAEEWANTERQQLREQLDRYRLWMVSSIGIIVVCLLVIGHWLARRVARPLRQLEESMSAVAAGRISQLELPVHDREIVSLAAAFNRMLRDLELRQGQLVRAEKLAALGTLLSGVAHELNNPLSNISTSCEILTEEIGAGRENQTLDPPTDGTAFQRELLGQIDAETWRARRIVRSLLDYARDRDFRPEDFALATLVEDSLRLIKARIPAPIDIHIDIPALLVLRGDKQRLQQALFNLIGNALDALAGVGTLTLAARRIDTPCASDTLVFGQCPAPAIEIEVADDGQGIPADTLPRIFDPFFTTKEVGHGLGLGLFIVFEIIEEHGGCIAVRSTPGTGSTFFLRLPAKE